jgi:hypothetical protein
MMPDSHIAENVASDFELDELVGMIGNCYGRRVLSPPSQLRGAVGIGWGCRTGKSLTSSSDISPNIAGSTPAGAAMVMSGW